MRTIRSGEDPILAKCEVAGTYVAETKQCVIKCGDGIRKWSELPRLSSPPYLAAPPRWIPVEERLPVDGQQVLMAYRFPDDNTCATWPHIVQEVRMSTADFLNGDFTEVDDAVRYTRQSVSHWMPLPEPPEVK